MRQIAIAAAILVATLAIGCGTETQPLDPEIRTVKTTPTAVPAYEEPRSNELAGAEGPTRYAPYADVVWPTPTRPAWLDNLNATGGTTDGAGPRRTDLSGAGSATATLLRLEVANAYEAKPYDRDQWGSWTDDDGDCQNTRAEVLQMESAVSVTFRSDAQCTVDTGEWIDPWTGQRFTEASDLDIDHHVPLANAHRSGGAEWREDRKRKFANDMSLPDSLNATLNTLNRQKGARGPEEWRPPDPATWCDYATRWVEVKNRWDLSITPRELRALTEMLGTCGR